MAPAPASSIELRGFFPLGGRDILLHPLHTVADPALFGLGQVGQSMVRFAQHASNAQLRSLPQLAEANPIAVAVALDDLTDRHWRDWEPKTLRDEFPGLDAQQMDKVMAVQVAVTNPDVFEQWHLFHHCAAAFNHRSANFSFMDPPSPAEAAWACTVLRALQSKQVFGPDVLKYLAVICIDDGLLYFPWTGGDGLAVCECPLVKGLVDPAHCQVSDKVVRAWKDGALQELAPSAVDDEDPWHVQASKIVAIQAYIRAQKPRDPAAYQVKES